MNRNEAIGISPFQRAGALQGFVISGRWPDTTKEWAQLLALAVRVASLPGLLPTTTVFGVHEDVPDDPQPGTVGLVMAEGPVLGDFALPPGRFSEHQPPALIMLHLPPKRRPACRNVRAAPLGASSFLACRTSAWTTGPRGWKPRRTGRLSR